VSSPSGNLLGAAPAKAVRFTARPHDQGVKMSDITRGRHRRGIGRRLPAALRISIIAVLVAEPDHWVANWLALDGSRLDVWVPREDPWPA
jgi:hypothetical protein